MSDNEVLHLAKDELLFRPSEAQYRAKSAFWSRFGENPICDPSDVTLATVDVLVNDSRIQRWWGQAGFREWFLNTNEFRERMETLAYKSLQKLDDIISLPTEPRIASAQVNAIKLMMEVARKMPPKHQSEKYLDEKIGKMSKAELESYIKKNLHLLPAGTENK